MSEHRIEWREAHGLPIEYCMTHGVIARQCRAEDMEPLTLSVEDAVREITADQYQYRQMEGNTFVARIGQEEFRVTVTPLCMSRFRHPCQNDTDGDGNCGQFGCPGCGVPEARVTYRCAGDRDHDGMHADEHGTFNWTDNDEVKA